MLEQFHLDGFYVSWRDEDSDPTPLTGHAKNTLWPSLKRLILGPELVYSQHAQEMDSDLSRILPPFTSNLRSIEILGKNDQIANNLLFTFEEENAGLHSRSYRDYDRLPNPPNLINLEVFRCRAHGCLIQYLPDLLQAPARAGNLKVFELELPPTYVRDHITNPVKELSYVHSDNLHTLGLYNFNFYHDRHDLLGYSGGFDAQPFIDWLECFPKLHTVHVYPGNWDGVDIFILRLISHPRVKVIHQDRLTGVNWDDAVKLAKQCGVELHHTPNFVPPSGWPMLEIEED
jgi:hypothetical protein